MYHGQSNSKIGEVFLCILTQLTFLTLCIFYAVYTFDNPDLEKVNGVTENCYVEPGKGIVRPVAIGVAPTP